MDNLIFEQTYFNVRKKENKLSWQLYLKLIASTFSGTTRPFMRLNSGCGEHLARTFSTIISVFSEQERRDRICLQTFETDV
jgi:hypothetical protein